MELRLAKPEDLGTVMKIYASAREFMKETGNPRQWGLSNWPSEERIRMDIAASKSYVCIEGSQIAAVFYYDFGKDIDPTYRNIEGAWLSDSPYGVVHRIASARIIPGAGSWCIQQIFRKSGHLRMDTHPDNLIMQKTLLKLGFQRTGLIHVEEDDDPRIAFEKI